MCFKHHKLTLVTKGGIQWVKMGENGEKWGLFFMGNGQKSQANSPFSPIKFYYTGHHVFRVGNVYKCTNFKVKVSLVNFTDIFHDIE